MASGSFLPHAARRSRGQAARDPQIGLTPMPRAFRTPGSSVAHSSSSNSGAALVWSRRRELATAAATTTAGSELGESCEQLGPKVPLNVTSVLAWSAARIGGEAVAAERVLLHRDGSSCSGGTPRRRRRRTRGSSSRAPAAPRADAPAPRTCLQLVAVDVVDMPDVAPGGRPGTRLGRIAEELRRAHQVRRGVADLVRPDPARADLTQQRAPLERVVDHLTLRTHARKSTPRADEHPFGELVAPAARPGRRSPSTALSLHRRTY